MSGSVILRGGTVVDGTGAPARRAEVAVVDGIVAAVGDDVERQLGAVPDLRRIDVSGLVVAPGFIDVHTHYDAQVCWDPSFEAIGQYGVTTVVMGNCGIGMAPLRPGGAPFLIQLLANVEGMPVASLEAVDWSWRSFADYLDAIDRPLGANVVALVGHSPLRHAVLGEEATERAATEDELVTLQAELRAALEAGGWGFSSSVAATHNDLAGRPAPSRLADRVEFEALADVVGERPFGIIGISPESKLRGLSEEDQSLLRMLSLRGGASVNWNPLVHSTAMPDLWRRNMDAIESAAAAGARVFGVFNPTSTGGTRVDLNTLFLFAFLPNWKPLVQASTAEKLTAFADPEVRARLAHDLEHDTSMGVLTARLRTMWDILRITSVASAANEPHLGRTVGEVARERGVAPLDCMLDLALADGLRTVFMQEDPRLDDPASVEAFEAMSSSPYVLFGGSDAGAHVDMLANESIPARTLAWRVREDGSLGVEEAVRRFTSAIADGLGLPDRGRLVTGQAGDVVAFDLESVDAGDAFVVADLPGGGERMMTRATGVRWTIAGGEVTFQDGDPTGHLGGRLLRSGGGRG